MKKLFTLFLALVMIVSMAACGKTDTPDNGGDNAGKATYRVGVCQLAQHPALDAATQGFVDALKEELGDDVNIEVQNASGESNNCSTIINGFLSSDVDLIMANATPALTAAASATSEVPILGTAVTAYGVALDLDDFGGTVGGNISGTSDLADLEKQAAMVTEWFPDAKKVGLLFCSAEPNSRYQIDHQAPHRQGYHLHGVCLHRLQRSGRRDGKGRRFQRRDLHPHGQHRCQQHREHRQHPDRRRCTRRVR